MGVLDPTQLTEMRQGCAKAMATGSLPIDYDKPKINAALQAVEDWFEKPAVKADLSSDIDAATTPFVFTGPQKKRLVAYWIKQKFGREGV